jgi:hypothetical protein
MNAHEDERDTRPIAPLAGAFLLASSMNGR